MENVHYLHCMELLMGKFYNLNLHRTEVSPQFKDLAFDIVYANKDFEHFYPVYLHRITEYYQAVLYSIYAPGEVLSLAVEGVQLKELTPEQYEELRENEMFQKIKALPHEIPSTNQMEKVIEELWIAKHKIQ